MNNQAVLLGQMIMDRNAYFGAGMSREHFSAGLMQDVYDSISTRYEAGKGVDLRLVATDLSGEYEVADIAEITDGVPSAANWRHYAEEVRKSWAVGRVRQIGYMLTEEAEDPEVTERAYKQLSEIEDAGEIYKPSDIVRTYVGTIEARYKSKGATPGYESGIEALDEATLGFQRRKLYYIGARPGDGKTALLLTFVVNLCKQGIACGMISLESSRYELMERLFANAGNIDNRTLATGMFSASDFGRITSVATTLHDWPLTIFDRENAPMSVVRAKAREMVRAYGAQVLFVDYLQLVKQTSFSQPFRLHMNDVSMGMKALARELDVPVICAAQLGRGAEERKPFLSDFKESGQIEQDADAAILIHHDEEHSWLLVQKNRDGKKADLMVRFNRPRMRFEAESRRFEEGV